MRLATLLASLPLAIASPTVLLFPRQTDYTYLGYLRSSTPAYNNYQVTMVLYDPTTLYGQPAVVGLKPPSDGDQYGLQFSINSGKLRGAGPFSTSDGSWFLMPETTGFVNWTDSAGASAGFSSSEDLELEYEGDATSWWACESRQTGGELVLYVEIGGVVPSDGNCQKITLAGGPAQ